MRYTTQYLASKNGYMIPYICDIKDNEKKIVIVSHGFGSSKGSPTVKMLFDNLPQMGIGVVAYDFPNHGESAVQYDQLRIKNCIDDLEDIEKMILNKNKNCEIFYFSSSFGAYINLQYLSNREHCGTKSFVRSGAVNMSELFQGTKDEEAQLANRGYVELDYEPKITVSKEFIYDLRENDLFKIYKANKTEIKMVHGEMDEVIDIVAAIDFAEQNNIDITIVSNGDHSLSKERMPQEVLELAIDFFQG